MSAPHPTLHAFVELRDATRADAAVIAEVHQASRVAALREIVPREALAYMTDRERRARWEQWLSDPAWTTILGELRGQVLGFCTVGPTRDPDQDPGAVAEMPTLYVHPSHWRRGVGRVLCAAAVARAARLGFRQLTLWTLEVNRRARLFYGSFGFEADGATRTGDDTLDTDLLALRFRVDLL